METKNEIKYIIISDMHLGEASGILTPINAHHEIIPTALCDVAYSLINLLESLIAQNKQQKSCTLILNGDILGLAFSKLHECLPLFGKLLNEMLSERAFPLFEKIYYLPGNHDHHIWEITRGEYYQQTIATHDGLDLFPRVIHSTKGLKDQAIRSSLFDGLMNCTCDPNALQHFPGVEILYPNMLLKSEVSGKTALIHHGHFAEDIYQFISAVHKALHPNTTFPTSVEGLEEENFAWIEFGWSLLGRSGRAGKDVENFMKVLANPNLYDDEKEEMALRIAEALDFPFIPSDFIEKEVIKVIIGRMSKKSKGERQEYEEACGTDTILNLKKYLDGPCYNQMKEELGSIPDTFSLIWGHTHKPFENLLTDDQNRKIFNYNIGGWTVDELKPDRIHGASILFMNDGLDIATLNVFNNGNTDGHVILKISDPVDPSNTAFSQVMSEKITGIPEAAKEELSDSIKGAIRFRHQIKKLHG